jgi:hypothetical protein
LDNAGQSCWSSVIGRNTRTSSNSVQSGIFAEKQDDAGNFTRIALVINGGVYPLMPQKSSGKIFRDDNAFITPKELSVLKLLGQFR